MKKTIHIKQINGTERIVYLMTEDGVKIKAFIESDLKKALSRVEELSSIDDINSVTIEIN